jgi:hypothetical protein
MIFVQTGIARKNLPSPMFINHVHSDLLLSISVQHFLYMDRNPFQINV